MTNFTVRPATLADLPLLVEQRHAMFVDMGTQGSEDLAEHDAGYAAWLQRALPTGEYVGWLAEDEAGDVVAGAGLWVMGWPPHPVDPTAGRGCLMNVYTRPEARHQGLARRLLAVLLDWCCENGVRLVSLNASDDGRGLYESLGFEEVSGDMVLHLKA